MKWLGAVLLTLIVSVLLALAARHDPGYVLITRGGWTVETSLVVLLIAVIALFAALHLLLRTIANTRALPKRLAAWRERRRALKARRATHRGLIELAEGHWERAEALLTKGAEHAEVPLLNYLGAARAAQKQCSDERRDHYLSMAHRVMPEAELAVGLTQAEVQLSHGQLEQALATLVHLRRVAPKNAHVLYLLKRLYERLGSWEDLAGLLPGLRRHKVVEPGELDRLERRVYRALLAQAANEDGIETLRHAWMRVPRPLREDPELLAGYVQQLVAAGQNREGEQLLREELRKGWEPLLGSLYGRIEGPAPNHQLEQAEQWLKEYGERPELLLTAGRLAQRNQLWGKARSYLEAAVGLQPSAETLQELGALLERMGEPGAAADCFRRGLALATREGQALALPS